MIRFDTRPNPSAAPSFLESKNRRQKVRAAGLHPDYWYPVEKSENLKPGKVIETNSGADRSRSIATTAARFRRLRIAALTVSSSSRWARSRAAT